MELYVCDDQFKRLGVVGSFSYLLWKKRYTKHGEAELHVDATTQNIELLRKGNILYRKDDNEAMYIYYRGFKDDEQGVDTLIVKCFTLIRWLDRRLIWGNWGFHAESSGVVGSMIKHHCITPSNPDRRIPQIKLAGNVGFGPTIYLESSYVNLLEQVESLCNTYEMGIRGLFDGKDFLIDLYEGVDRTINQSNNPRIILSKEFSNVLTRNYEESDNDFKNSVAITMNRTNNETKRIVTSIEQGSGLSRRELLLDATNIPRTVNDENGNEITYTDQEFELVLKQKGHEKLLEHEEYRFFDCEMDVTKENTKYGRDFYLGDLITIRDDKLGVVMNSRILEADEVFRNVEKSVYVKVGKSVPTLAEKIKRMVK